MLSCSHITDCTMQSVHYFHLLYRYTYICSLLTSIQNNLHHFYHYIKKLYVIFLYPSTIEVACITLCIPVSIYGLDNDVTQWRYHVYKIFTSQRLMFRYYVTEQFSIKVVPIYAYFIKTILPIQPWRQNSKAVSCYDQASVQTNIYICLLYTSRCV